MHAAHQKKQSGFTLIELLVVIGILAVLLAIVLIAINPARQFAQANNTQRRSDVTAVLNAIHQYAADNSGTLPTGVPTAGETEEISFAGTGAAFCNALVPTYVAALPRDPTGGTFVDCNNYDTKFQITASVPVAGSTPRVTISAPNAELGLTISVTR